jgi:uncharacterized protein
MNGEKKDLRDRVEIIERESVKFKNPIIIEGFPSVGLVGAIATEFIAGELKMKDIGFISSRFLPPVILVKDGEPKAPIRIYAKDDLIVIVSDTAVPTFLAHDVSEAIVAWAKEKNVKKIVSVGGIQHPEDEKEMKVYALSPFPELLKEAKKKKIERVELGFLTGVMGLLMMECIEYKVPIIGLLADAHYGYPDPAAAASVVNELNKILELNIDTKPLIEASKQIEKRFSTLIKTAQETMDKQPEIPGYPTMYG